VNPTDRPRPAELRLEVVGTDRIVVGAGGAFTSASFDYVASRLARLVAGAPACVEIDCSRVTAMDPEIADLFSRTAVMLVHGGGALELTGVPASLGVVDRLTAGGSCTRRGPMDDRSVVGGVIGDVVETKPGRGPAVRRAHVGSTERVAS